MDVCQLYLSYFTTYKMFTVKTFYLKPLTTSALTNRVDDYR
jgi:hypothetical protein